MTETLETTQASDASTAAAPPAEGVKSDSGDKGPVPYDRFSKKVGEVHTLTDALKVATDKLDTIEADAKKIRDAKLVQDGEAKTLITEQGEIIESMTKDLEKYQTQDQSRRETLILEIPEDSREIYKDLPLDKLEAHVKAVRGTATDASGMVNNSSESNNTEAPKPKSRKDMTTKELIADGANRRAEFLTKYGGVTVDQLKHPTRVTG